MVKTIYRRGVPRDAYDTEVQEEREIDVNDDNPPTTENLPVSEVASHIIPNKKFDQNGLFHRCMDQCINSIEQLIPNISGTVDFIPAHLHFFKFFIPKAVIKEVFIPHTNRNMMDGGQVLICEEFLTWIGMWLMMATIKCFQCHYFWSNRTISPFDTAPYRFNDIIPCTRFKEIIKAFAITDKKPPEYKGPFGEVRQMVDVWNYNTEIFFSPSYIYIFG